MLLLLLASCTEDAAEVDDLMRKEQLMVTMHVPGMKNVATRAEGETITKITALTFRNGTLAKQQDAHDLSQTHFVIDMPQNGDVIHFFANCNVTLPQNNANISDLTSLEVNDANLTYWGTTTYHTGSSLSVTLYRNKAMVAIAPSTTDTEFNAFTQDQLRIVGFATAYSSGMLVPYKNEAFDFSLGDTEDTDYYTLPTDVTPANTEIGPTPSAYVFEHENTAQNPMYAICMIGGGYYKVALSDALGNLYPIIRNHKYTIYVADLDDVDSNLRANNYNEALNKAPINLEVKEELQLGITTSASTMYLGSNPFTVTITVPIGATLNTLTISAEGFTINNTHSNTFTDETDRVGNTTVQYTFNPTSIGTKKIVFTGSGENIAELDASFDVIVKDKIDVEPKTSTTLYYDATAEQTVTVDVTVPAGVETLKIEADDFTVSQNGTLLTDDDSDGFYTYTVTNASNPISFVFTLDKTKFSAERTSTITFSDANDNEFIEDAKVNIDVKATPQQGEEIVIYGIEHDESETGIVAENKEVEYLLLDLANKQNKTGVAESYRSYFISGATIKIEFTCNVTESWHATNLRMEIGTTWTAHRFAKYTYNAEDNNQPQPLSYTFITDEETDDIGTDNTNTINGAGLRLTLRFVTVTKISIIPATPTE